MVLFGSRYDFRAAECDVSQQDVCHNAHHAIILLTNQGNIPSVMVWRTTRFLLINFRQNKFGIATRVYLESRLSTQNQTFRFITF